MKFVRDGVAFKPDKSWDGKDTLVSFSCKWGANPSALDTDPLVILVNWSHASTQESGTRPSKHLRIE